MLTLARVALAAFTLASIAAVVSAIPPPSE